MKCAKFLKHISILSLIENLYNHCGIQNSEFVKIEINISNNGVNATNSWKNFIYRASLKKIIDGIEIWFLRKRSMQVFLWNVRNMEKVSGFYVEQGFGRNYITSPDVQLWNLDTWKQEFIRKLQVAQRCIARCIPFKTKRDLKNFSEILWIKFHKCQR